MVHEEHWVILTKHGDTKPCGWRCWHRDFRCDVMQNGEKWDYYLAECFGGPREIYWTETRSADTVWEAIQKGVEWLVKHADEYWDGFPDEEPIDD